MTANNNTSTKEVKTYLESITDIRTLTIEQIDTCEFFSSDEKKKMITQIIGIDTLRDLLDIKTEITNKISALSKSIA